jgi:nucleoid-associated protein YgaU
MSHTNAAFQQEAAGVRRRQSDPSEATTARLYRVQCGDDLRSIAEELYGLADFWVFIYAANAEEISKREGIHPGQALYIPDL